MEKNKDKSVFPFVGIAAVLLSVLMVVESCEKAPGDFDRDGEYLVYTAKSKTADFSRIEKFTIGDSVLVIGGKEPKFSKSPDAIALVNKVKEKMTGRGYTFTADPQNAEAGFVLTLILDRQQHVAYPQDPYWWLDYPDYWGNGYWGTWGDWYGWYHPYPVAYTMETTTFMIDLADLTAPEGQGKKLPLIWSAVTNGYSGAYFRTDMERLHIAIDQAFKQSPYIVKPKNQKK